MQANLQQSKQPNQNRQNMEINQGYKFTSQKNNYSHYLQCKICTKLMIQPTRLYPCGHTFCKSCILQHNKNISQQTKSSKQNKCFVPFPECGKYYITLQPDLLAASLIDDLEVHCLSDGCPWTGTLQRFKLNHKDQCKLKKGGLESWLNDMKEGMEKIDKERKERKERKDNICIDIDDDIQMETFSPNQKISETENKINVKKIRNKQIGNLIKASNGPFQDEKNQKDILGLSQDSFSVEFREKQSQDFSKIRLPLGLNKDRVGDMKKGNKKQNQVITVQIDDQDQLENAGNQDNKPINKNCQKTTISLDEDMNLSEDCLQKQIGQKKQKSGINKTQQSQNTKKIESNFTGMKMINSYKKKSHKIAQNPNNMNLTRSKPKKTTQFQYQTQ